MGGTAHGSSRYSWPASPDSFCTDTGLLGECSIDASRTKIWIPWSMHLCSWRPYLTCPWGPGVPPGWFRAMAAASSNCSEHVRNMVLISRGLLSGGHARRCLICGPRQSIQPRRDELELVQSTILKWALSVNKNSSSWGHLAER